MAVWGSLLLALNFLITQTQGISLSITPEHCIATTVNEVQVSCVIPNDDDKEISLISISRNDEEPIAFLKHCSNVTIADDTSSQFKAEGYIGKQFNQSYLNLTLAHPRSEDTGIYTCAVHYVDNAGVLRNEKTSQNFLVENVDAKTLEAVLNSLKDKISYLEKKTQRQNAAMLKDVMGRMATFNKRITGFEKNVTKDTVIFVAKDSKENLVTTSDKVLIFPDVHLNVEGGYDAHSGVFTAPQSGFYNFHVLLTTKKSASWVQVQIKVNEEVLAHLGVGDKDYYVQSSGSAIAKLTAGDRVYLYVTSGGDLQGGPKSVFSGYLIVPF